MKKSSFTAMIMGTIGGILTAIGMCMSLLPQWNEFKPGVVMGCAGLSVLLAALITWRKMEHKSPIRLNGKTILTGILGVSGALVLGVGMCLAMVWGKMVLGIVTGIAGIIALLSLIPLIKGIKTA